MGVNRDQISLDLYTTLKEAGWALSLANDAMTDLWLEVCHPNGPGLVSCEDMQALVDAVDEANDKAKRLTVYMPVSRVPVDLENRMPF